MEKVTYEEFTKHLCFEINPELDLILSNVEHYEVKTSKFIVASQSKFLATLLEATKCDKIILPELTNHQLDLLAEYLRYGYVVASQADLRRLKEVGKDLCMPALEEGEFIHVCSFCWN